MQATLCDNCRRPAAGPQEVHGWRKLGKLSYHGPEALPEGMPEPPPAIKKMLAQITGGAIGGGEEGHVDCETQYDLCSDACVVAFVRNDYKPSFSGLADDLTPEQFAEAVVVDPEPPTEG